MIAGGTGFLMDDEMDDFTVKPGLPNMFGLVQGVANVIAPGKRPLSSRAPTIILRDGQLRLVTGSPGISRIITIVLERVPEHDRPRHDGAEDRGCAASTAPMNPHRSTAAALAP